MKYISHLPSYPPVTIILLKYMQEISYFETEKGEGYQHEYENEHEHEYDFQYNDGNQYQNIYLT